MKQLNELRADYRLSNVLEVLYPHLILLECVGSNPANICLQLVIQSSQTWINFDNSKILRPPGNNNNNNNLTFIMRLGNAMQTQRRRSLHIGKTHDQPLTSYIYKALSCFPAGNILCIQSAFLLKRSTVKHY